jgi:hypothetical protein
VAEICNSEDDGVGGEGKGTLASWGAARLQYAIHPSNAPLAKALAVLYTRAQRYRDALGIYLKFQQPEAFELIEQHDLFQSVKVGPWAGPGMGLAVVVV